MRTLFCLTLAACSFEGNKTTTPDADAGNVLDGAVDDGGRLIDGSLPTTDAPAIDVNPVGMWHVTLTFAPNACGESVSNETIIVDANHVATLDGTPGVGSITCDPSHCAFDEAFTFMASGSSSKLSLQLSLAPNGSITGSGSLASMPPYCLATLTAQGARS